MRDLVLMEAMADVTGVMRDGAQLLFSETTGKFEHVAFADLSQPGRVAMLEALVDWNPYFDSGLLPEQAERIVENAADGKPQDRWLEPLANEEQRRTEREAAMQEAIFGIRDSIAKRQDAPCFSDLLESYAVAEPAGVEMQHGLER